MIDGEQWKKEKWRPWEGDTDDHKPHDDVVVQVKYRRGDGDTNSVSAFDWWYEGDDLDIVAYRIVEE